MIKEIKIARYFYQINKEDYIVFDGLGYELYYDGNYLTLSERELKQIPFHEMRKESFVLQDTKQKITHWYFEEKK